MRTPLVRPILVAAALTLVSATPAHAAEEGGGNILSPSGGVMVWTTIIFFLLLAVLSRFAFKPMLAAVEARERALREALDQAKRDREAAAALVAEHRKQIEAARGDAQQLIAEGRAAGEKMRADILAQAHAQQQEVLERARREIESEKVKAIVELRREAVDLAILGAGKVIERNLDDAGNRKLVESYLASLAAAQS